LTHQELVCSGNGMVATGHPLSSWAGAKVLSEGGNAMDAAIAAATVMNVVTPNLCGIGGDAFILYYDAKSKEVIEFNGSGKAPLGASREYFLNKGFKKMPLDGILSAAVPGQVDAICHAHKYASKSLEDLFSFAIDYAENGFPISNRTATEIYNHQERLKKDSNAKQIFFKNGKPLDKGDYLFQKDLAKTLKEISTKGKEYFYKGEFFEQLMDFSAEEKGLFQGEEWFNHQTRIIRPIRTTYRGFEIYETTPPSQGYMLLEGMNILENLSISNSLSYNETRYMIEIKKRVFHNRLKYMGDPFNSELINQLISKEHAKDEYEKIKLNMREMTLASMKNEWFSEDTTYLTVADQMGNVVSWIHSLSEDFGCGRIVDGTGVFLNNRAGRGFSLVKDHPNVVAPGKKTMHTLNCWLVLENGKPKWTGGTPGGDGQVQWNMQLLSHLIDSGMNPQQAVEAPRWLHFPGTDPETIDEASELRIESHFDKQIVQKLQTAGYAVKVIDPWTIGGNAQIIEIDQKNGVFYGGSDLREDGMAIGI